MIQSFQNYRGLSTTDDRIHVAILSPNIPDLRFSTIRQAHSIVSRHRNALIFLRKNILLIV